MTFKRFVPLVCGATLLLTLILPLAAEAYTNNDLIDNIVFDNSSSMSAAQIDSFLNGFSGSCISTNNGFSAPDPVGYNSSQGYLYGATVSAGTAIYDAAQAYELNPQVLLTKLQNEEGLVVGDGAYGCSALAISASVGYGCPDSGGSFNYTYPGNLVTPLYYSHGSAVNSISGTCVNSASKAGFSEQIIHAAWLLKFGRMRSEGNTGWAIVKGNWNNSDDLSTCYGGPMTQGSFKRCASDSSPTFYDGYTTINGQSLHMDSGATATLYWYTPHIQSFSSIFQGWFGSPNSPCMAVGNVTGAHTGASIIAYDYNLGAVTNLSLILANNTGSNCVESHGLNAPAGQAWYNHVVTAMRSFDPTTGMIVASKSSVDGQNSLNYIVYNGAGSKVEVHRMSPNSIRFPGYYDVSTNLGAVSPTAGTFVAGDFLGTGSDQLAYILYSGTGGKVEVHLFDPSMQKAVGYRDLITNLGAVTASQGAFVAGDFLGLGRDQLAFVLYSNNSGHVEVHVFDPTLQQAIGYHDILTNLNTVNASTGGFVAGHFLGNPQDQLSFIQYTGGSSGHVEVHVFDPTLQRGVGYYDAITAVTAFDPTQ